MADIIDFASKKREREERKRERAANIAKMPAVAQPAHHKGYPAAASPPLTSPLGDRWGDMHQPVAPVHVNRKSDGTADQDALAASNPARFLVAIDILESALHEVLSCAEGILAKPANMLTSPEDWKVYNAEVARLFETKQRAWAARDQVNRSLFPPIAG